MKSWVLSIFLMCVYSASLAQTDTVLNRYRRYLHAQPRTDITSFITGFNERTQQWPDVSYTNNDRAGWKIAEHLKRVRALALAWSDTSSSYYKDTACSRIIHSALDHWLRVRYQSSNWWHNKIGVPQFMRDIVVLLWGTLKENELAQALEVMAQNDEASWRKSTGANLVWCADLAFHYGAFTGDTAMMRRCIETIWQEVKVTTKEGIQPDYSFHQHGPRLQIYHYGRAFLQDNVRLIWQTKGTPWACPPDKAAIIASFIREGWRWMKRGIYTVPGTVDRAVSRPNTLMVASIPFLDSLPPPRGFRHFPRSDFSVYHRPGFSFFLKTMSDHTLPTESINGENLKGHLLNSGDGYFIRNGNEYTNLMPAWDWERLPGTTAFPVARHPFTGSVSDSISGLTVVTRRPFTGGVSDSISGLTGITRHPFTGSVSDSISGLTVMDFGKGKKFWACHENMMVCLIAGMPGVTTMDQCRWQGDVLVNTQPAPLQAGDHHLKTISWIYHNKLAYMPLSPAAVHLSLGEQSGSWQSVNASGSAEVVREQVFKPMLADAAGYAVGYFEDASQITRSWKVLMNTSACQALQFEDGTVIAAFYEAGSLPAAGLSVDKACLVLVKGGEVYVADPLRRGGEVKVNGRSVHLGAKRS